MYVLDGRVLKCLAFLFGGVGVWEWVQLFLKNNYNLSSGEVTGGHFQSLEYLVQKCGTFYNLVQVQGEIKRSRDLRGGRWSWTLNFAQKRS